MLTQALLILTAVATVPARPGPGIGFIENKGQWDGRAKYLLSSSQVNFWVTGQGASLEFAGKNRRHNVRMTFTGARQTQPIGVGEKLGKLNYLIGDEANWATDVRHFEELAAPKLYEGVSARYYVDAGNPRYDLILAPGGDPGRIKMRFEGAQSLKLNAKGDLQIGTSIGTASMKGLFAFQQEGKEKKQVACKMVLEGDTLGFKLGSYDKRKALIIDPAIFNTYVGGSVTENPNFIGADAEGNVVLTGMTESTDFPTSVGALDSTGSSFDAYILKLTPDGTSMIFGTYFGGPGGDICFSGALDAEGNVVVAGRTDPNGFPTTSEAFQTSTTGTAAFISKISASGTALLWSTFYAGSSLDQVFAVTVGGNGDVYVAGDSRSSDLPTTPGAFDRVRDNSQDKSDLFIARFSGNGKTLVYGTFMGGPDVENVSGIKVDSAGNAVICGSTTAGLPVSAGAFDTSFSGTLNGFIAKFTGTGGLIFSTYMGGDGLRVNDLAIAPSGSILFTGNDVKGTFPATTGAFDTSQNGAADAIVGNLSQDGSTLIAGTYLGTVDFENGEALVATPNGWVVVVGSAHNAGFADLAEEGPDQAFLGTTDGFIALLSPALDRFVYADNSGGNDADDWRAITLNSKGRAFLAGVTSSTVLPSSIGTYDPTLSGSSDSMVTEHDFFPRPRLADLIVRDNAGVVSGQSTAIVGGSPFTIWPLLASPSNVNVTVALSDNTTAIVTPASVEIPTNSVGASAVCTTSPVAATAVRQVTATLTGWSITRNIVLVAASFVLRDPAGVTSSSSITVVGGQPFTATVGLSAPLARSITVALNDNTSAISSPGAATIPQGSTLLNANYTTTSVSAEAVRTVNLTLDNLGLARSVRLITSPILISLTMSPTSVKGGVSSTGTVKLLGVSGAGGTPVALADNSSVISVPASVSVQSGATQGTFTATTSPVAATVTRQITATRNGVSKSASLTLTP